MESTDDGAKLARKFSLVVREFPPGCGSRASKCKRGKILKRKVAIKSNVGKILPEKRPNQPATGSSTTVVQNPGLTASSSQGVSAARERVIESLQFFRALCKELSREKSAGAGQKVKIRRVDLKAWTILKNEGGGAHGGKQFMGVVPGVEIGDRFYYRIELAVVGLHRPPQTGIDYMKRNGDILATSIVASSNTDNMSNADELVYVGEGGISNNSKFHEDQKLVRGNLAMRNSIRVKNPVRVIRKVTASFSDTELTTSTPEIFVYDGLYVVQSCTEGHGDHGRTIFKFKLERMPGQPPIARHRG